MADAAEVFAGITRKPGVRYSALVPNARGLERAIACSIDDIAIFAAASETFSRKNINQSIDESLAILRQVAAGLDAIHAARTAHRDLKPANILVGDDGRVKITDLGLARAVDRAHAVRGLHVSGTPAYIAPEVASLREVAPSLLPKADIYSLGVIAFQLLTGRVPFQSRTLGELLVQHASVPPPPPCSLNPELPAAFDEALSFALAKDPEARPPSARAGAAAASLSSRLPGSCSS